MTCSLYVERVKKEEYERKKEDKVRKTLENQVLISTRVRNSKDRKVLISLHLRDRPTAQGSAQATGSKTILPAPSGASALRGSSRGPAPPYCTHSGRKHKGECWRLTGACLVCGSNEHKVKDCPRARSFTAPRTEGTVLAVQKSNKDNKSVASPSTPRQATQTMGS